MQDVTSHEGTPSLFRRILLGLRWRWNRVLALTKPQRDRLRVAIRWWCGRPGELHGLPAPLILSLTSYGPRFPTLGLTLRCLLTQSIRPDRIILWIGHDDEARVPADVLALRQHGLEIRSTNDMGPFTKIIPTLRAFPDAFIVTADDDIYYRRRWLEELIEGWDGRPNLIVCHRAHKVTFDISGKLLPYRQWVFDSVPREESVDLFPTGVGGVLYPPGSLGPDVLDDRTFRALCPRNDDIWLYWMGRRAGATYRTIARRREFSNWAGSQEVAIFLGNVLMGRNDEQILNMIKKFGYPAAALFPQ